MGITWRTSALLLPTAMSSRSSRAGRFKASKAACKEVRRAVALAEELGLHSVALRGAVWTLRHGLAEQRDSSSGQRIRAAEDAAGAAEQAAEERMEVPEREPRPLNRRQRRSRARMGVFNQAREQALRDGALEPAPVASSVNGAASSAPADEAMTLHELAYGVDEQRAQERSQMHAASSSAVDESFTVWASTCPTATEADAGAFASRSASGSPKGRPSTSSLEPPTPPPEELAARLAARRLSEACASAAADAAQRSTPLHKRRRKRGARAHARNADAS